MASKNALRLPVTIMRGGTSKGAYILQSDLPADQDACALASELETCLHHYQKLWRSNSKEGDLGHITEVFCWYADLLRSLI